MCKRPVAVIKYASKRIIKAAIVKHTIMSPNDYVFFFS